MKDDKLLFFTYADKKYDFFAVPYVYFALISTPGSKVEICLEDFELFKSKYSRGIEALEKRFPNRFLFRQSKLASSGLKILPNSVRFLEEPELKSEYIYIADIDIMVLENVLDVHLDLIKKYNLPFSNVIRKKSNPPKLSGLHFSSWHSYYPISDYSDLDVGSINDEELLYLLMSRKRLMVPESFNSRPILGLHMTGSRDALGRTTGAVKGKYKRNGLPWQSDANNFYYNLFVEKSFSDDFFPIYKYCDINFKTLALLAEAIAEGKEKDLHRYAVSHLLDRRLLVASENEEVKIFKKRIRTSIASKNYKETRLLISQAYSMWPKDASIYLIGLNFFRMINDHELAKESYFHMIGVGGAEYFKRLDENDSLYLYLLDHVID